MLWMDLKGVDTLFSTKTLYNRKDGIGERSKSVGSVSWVSSKDFLLNEMSVKHDLTGGENVPRDQP